MSKIDEAQKILTKLKSSASDIKDLAIVRTNGLIISSLHDGGMQGDKTLDRLIGGMASALYSISKRAAEQLLNKGSFRSLNIEIDHGNIFIIYTGMLILIALTKPEPNVGLLSLEMEDAAKKINNIFE